MTAMRRVERSTRPASVASSDALNRVTEDFAARRMDRSVKAALTGQKIANLKV